MNERRTEVLRELGLLPVWRLRDDRMMFRVFESGYDPMHGASVVLTQRLVRKLSGVVEFGVRLCW